MSSWYGGKRHGPGLWAGRTVTAISFMSPQLPCATILIVPPQGEDTSNRLLAWGFQVECVKIFSAESKKKKKKRQKLKIYKMLSFAENKNALCIWQGTRWKQIISKKALGGNLLVSISVSSRYLLDHNQVTNGFEGREIYTHLVSQFLACGPN